MKSYPFLFLLLAFSSLFAQPTISFQIRNEVRTGNIYAFDIYARGDSNYTFHNRGQLYLNYSSQAFGDSIVAKRRIKRPKHLFLLNEISFIGPKYVTLNYVDNTSNRISITWESNFSGIPPLPGAHTEVPPKWTSLYHLEFTMVDTTAEAGISFEQNLMKAQQFYLFDVNDERPYKFLSTYPTYLKRALGRAFFDQNKDSVFNQQDIPLAHWIVKATPGPYYGMTDSLGMYKLLLDTGNFQISLHPPKGQSGYSVFPASHQQAFAKNTLDRGGLNFAVQLDACPLAEVRIFAKEHRLCDSSSFYLQYANRGILPIPSPQIELKMPVQIKLLQGSMPFSSPEPGLYRFQLPTLPPLKSGLIQLWDSSSCDQLLAEKAICLEARMSPDNFCTQKDTAWSGAELSAVSYCDPGQKEVFFVIHNTGLGDMKAASSYYLIADDSLIYSDQLQLMQADSLRLKVKAQGQHMQLIVRQEQDHPTHSWFKIYQEACGNPARKSLLAGFQASDPDFLTFDRLCLELTKTRDSSATFATPYGLDAPHFIGDSTELSTGVRFLNGLPNAATGWINIDSLSANTDPLTFRPGPVSHPARLDVYGKGNMILDHYGFQLPRNAELHFFYRISPQKGLPSGTEINNSAGSCLDTFPPIMSDTLLRTIGKGLKLALNPGRVTLNPPGAGIGHELPAGWKIFPNPARESVWITSENRAFDKVELWDMMGHRILQQAFARPEFSFQLALPKLPSGVYLLRVYASEKSLVYRLVVE